MLSWRCCNGGSATDLAARVFQTLKRAALSLCKGPQASWWTSDKWADVCPLHFLGPPSHNCPSLLNQVMRKALAHPPRKTGVMSNLFS